MYDPHDDVDMEDPPPRWWKWATAILFVLLMGAVVMTSGCAEVAPRPDALSTSYNQCVRSCAEVHSVARPSQPRSGDVRDDIIRAFIERDRQDPMAACVHECGRPTVEFERTAQTVHTSNASVARAYSAPVNTLATGGAVWLGLAGVSKITDSAGGTEVNNNTTGDSNTVGGRNVLSDQSQPVDFGTGNDVGNSSSEVAQ